MTEIVPFGKYRGKPVEVLQNDPAYVDWLMGQNWFADRYKGIHTVIVNNFGEPSETPEHNAMQAKFLEGSHCIHLLLNVVRGLSIPPLLAELYCDRSRDAESSAKDCVTHLIDHTVQKHELFLREGDWGRALYYLEDMASIERWVNLMQDAKSVFNALGRSIKTKFEFEGFDVAITATPHIIPGAKGVIADANRRNTVLNPDLRKHTINVYCELKPIMGDDYPAVLRQILANEKRGLAKQHNYCVVLVVGEYTGVGATYEQVVRIFAASEVLVLRSSDLEDMHGYTSVPPQGILELGRECDKALRKMVDHASSALSFALSSGRTTTLSGGDSPIADAQPGWLRSPSSTLAELNKYRDRAVEINRLLK